MVLVLRLIGLRLSESNPGVQGLGDSVTIKDVVQFCSSAGRQIIQC